MDLLTCYSQSLPCQAQTRHLSCIKGSVRAVFNAVFKNRVESPLKKQPDNNPNFLESFFQLPQWHPQHMVFGSAVIRLQEMLLIVKCGLKFHRKPSSQECASIFRLLLIPSATTTSTPQAQSLYTASYNPATAELTSTMCYSFTQTTFRNLVSEDFFEEELKALHGFLHSKFDDIVTMLGKVTSQLNYKNELQQTNFAKAIKETRTDIWKYLMASSNTSLSSKESKAPALDYKSPRRDTFLKNRQPLSSITRSDAKKNMLKVLNTERVGATLSSSDRMQQLSSSELRHLRKEYAQINKSVTMASKQNSGSLINDIVILPNNCPNCIESQTFARLMSRSKSKSRDYSTCKYRVCNVMVESEEFGQLYLRAIEYSQIQDMIHERDILKRLPQLSHPGLPNYFYLKEDPHRIVMTDTYYSKNLFQHIEANRTVMSLNTKLRYLKQIGQTLAYLHEYGIIYHHLTPENIILDRGFVKLTNFSNAYCKELSHKSNQPQAIIQNRQPYVWNVMEGRYATYKEAKADVFSFGVIGFQILTGSKYRMQGLEEDSSAIPSMISPVMASEKLDSMGNGWVVRMLLHLLTKAVAISTKQSRSMIVTCENLDDKLSHTKLGGLTVVDISQRPNLDWLAISIHRGQALMG